MIRLGFWVAACFVLTLCACGKERPDPRLAELTTPVHVTVRVIDAPIEKHCEGTAYEQFKCMVSRADRQGCVYVEVGAAADTPELRKTPDAARCMTMRGESSDRVVLFDGPGRKAKLTIDASKTRIVVELADSVHALYLRDSHLVIQRNLGGTATGGLSPIGNLIMVPGGVGNTGLGGLGATGTGVVAPDGTVDWSRVPAFLSVLDEAQLISLTEEELDTLIAETPSGRDALKTSLLAMTDSASLADKAWARAVSKLDPADQKQLRNALLTQISVGSSGALEWFDAHPEEQKADFIDALAD